MSSMMIAAFHDSENADMAVDELESMGFSPKDISIVTKENRRNEMENVTENATEGAVEGATTGTVLGGVAGLLAGAGVIPALAGLLIGGPIAAALGATGIVATTISGAVTGAVAGGLIGALTKLGVSEENARYYDETINSGGLMLAVPVKEDQRDEVRTILQSHNAEKISDISTES